MEEDHQVAFRRQWETVLLGAQIKHWESNRNPVRTRSHCYGKQPRDCPSRQEETSYQIIFAREGREEMDTEKNRKCLCGWTVLAW
jgi:hypothetical protein